MKKAVDLSSVSQFSLKHHSPLQNDINIHELCYLSSECFSFLHLSRHTNKDSNKYFDKIYGTS